MATDDFFRARLDQMIDLRHALAVLATPMPWAQIEASLAPVFAHRDRKGRPVEGSDLFGPSLAVAGAGVSNAGRPRLPIRLMVALLYLKHAYNESDESVVVRWSQDVYFQFFSGQVYFEPRLPCDPAQISRFRRVLGEAGVEQLLKTTIEAAVAMGAVKKTEFERVIVDSTVQSKAIAHPTDSRLLELAREKIARLAKRAGIQLKQTHQHEGQTLRRRAGGYAHAKQFKRLRAVLKRQRTILGRLLREVRRKMGGLADETRASLDTWVERAERIHRQRPKDKNKLYALHAPEAECIGKGKARQPYEFGVKVSIATTLKEGLVVGMRSMPGNPYDGHTLAETLEQVGILTGTDRPPATAIVDKGYQGVQIEGVRILRSGQRRGLTKTLKAMIKRRSAIEPAIGHMKMEGRLARNPLKGALGDALHAVMCGAGHNLRLILAALRLYCARIGLSVQKVIAALIAHSLNNRPACA